MFYKDVNYVISGMEKIENIIWSREDSNIVYFQSTNRVVKQLISKINLNIYDPDKNSNIGYFTVSNSDNILGFSANIGNLGDQLDDIVVVTDTNILITRGDVKFITNSVIII